MNTLAGWAVHAYTATGVVLALLMVHLSYEGEVTAVLWLFLVAMVIDGTDGFLARRFRVKEVVPQIDGALLDNIVDYLTYAFAPMALLWSTGRLPDGVGGAVVAVIPLVAASYQFCRSDAKTDDHFFLGFPSYWNIVAFYVLVLDLDVAMTTLLLMVLAVLSFVPVKYVYPSRTATLWGLNMTLASAWLVVFALITWQMPDPPVSLVLVSLVYPAVYLAESLWLTARHARGSHEDDVTGLEDLHDSEGIAARP
ncbi:CDP-alcohol phosphatidyltransferase family protein [Nocardioides ochotonae]|uniref:CDP-alcohol phosphatidyltransferase family protein n=1 Tax=Nocardioides ochotonae TaxID=2685869 RepID=UPI001CD6E1A0|nr:CDP-alcohol phosphatidyltransferase family protein [Nocardioides ochotonae]